MSKRIAFLMGTLATLVVIGAAMLWSSWSGQEPSAALKAPTTNASTSSNTTQPANSGSTSVSSQPAPVTAASANLQTTPATPPPSINVNGTGLASAAPDIARIQIGVTSRAATAILAVNDNNKKQAAVIEVLKKNGVDPKDIQTTNFSVNAEQRSNPNGSTTITGYVASNTVRVTIRKLDQVGEILDAVVTAGSNQIYGISFGVSDPEKLLSEARVKAVANAKAKAEELAKAAGVKVGKVLSISEFGGVSPRDAFGGGVVAAESRSVPIESGETQITAQVQITYAIE